MGTLGKNWGEEAMVWEEDIYAYIINTSEKCTE